MLHEHITGQIIKAIYQVYTELGYGFLESVYEKALVIALREMGLKAETQVAANVHFRSQLVGEFRCDLLVEDLVIVELKACRAMDKAFEAQLLNYLKATDVEVGILVNFGPKIEFKRFVFDNPRKTRCGTSDPLDPC